MKTVHAALLNARGEHPLRLRVADSFATRLRGLMGRAPLGPHEGLLLLRCASVHTAFLRAAIDVVFIDDSGRLVRCVPRLKPWRASGAALWAGARARHTLELAAGSIHRLGLNSGDRLQPARWDGAVAWR
jgi:uncharacterized membrane protein (UPF0127 family)